MRIFKSKWFVRFARKEGITDAQLREAVTRAVSGIIDADLGGGVLKQRVARPNEGKSRGFRSIVLFRAGDRAIFVYGFPKRSRDNLRADELQGFKRLAEEMLNYDDPALARALGSGALSEVVEDEQDLSE